MNFEDFTKLCGVSIRSPIENGHSMCFCSNFENSLNKFQLKKLDRTNVNSNDVDESLKIMLDNRIDVLREDFKDDLNRTKLSMQMNFIVELEKLRVKI